MIELRFNMDSLMSKLDAIIHGLPTAIDEAMQECGEVVVKEEAQRTKGELSKSFFTYKDGDVQIIDSPKEYAKYVESGRGPITATKAKALRFEVNGEVIFRKSVGPMKAQPYVKDSLRAASKQFTQVFNKHINKLVRM